MDIIERHQAQAYSSVCLLFEVMAAKLYCLTKIYEFLYNLDRSATNPGDM